MSAVLYPLFLVELYMAAQLTTEGLVWVRASNGKTVDDAIVGGTSSSGGEIHIARAHVSNNSYEELASGSLFVGHDCAYIPLKGKEHRINDYEILCNRSEVKIAWIPSYGRNVPTGAVQCGTDGTGIPIYIARYCHDGNVVPGKFIKFWGSCYISCGGREHQSFKYEMLCVKSVIAPSTL